MMSMVCFKFCKFSHFKKASLWNIGMLILSQVAKSLSCWNFFSLNKLSAEDLFIDSALIFSLGLISLGYIPLSLISTGGLSCDSGRLLAPITLAVSSPCLFLCPPNSSKVCPLALLWVRGQVEFRRYTLFSIQSSCSSF